MKRADAPPDVVADVAKAMSMWSRLQVEIMYNPSATMATPSGKACRSAVTEEYAVWFPWFNAWLNDQDVDLFAYNAMMAHQVPMAASCLKATPGGWNPAEAPRGTDALRAEHPVTVAVSEAAPGQSGTERTPPERLKPQAAPSSNAPLYVLGGALLVAAGVIVGSRW